MTTVVLEQGLGHYEQMMEDAHNDAKRAFLVIGDALREIQDGRLYLQSNHKTFEDYCQGRWGITRKRAYQLMGASASVEEMSQICDIALRPLIESHVAALDSVTDDPKEKVQILKKAAKAAPKDANGKPKLTAKGIKEAANPPKFIDPDQARIDSIKASQHVGNGKPSGGTTFDPTEFDTEMADKSTPVLDALGKPVPDGLKDIFRQMPAWAKAMQMVTNLKTAVTELCKHPASGYLDVQETERLLAQTRTNLKFAMPHTECPKCKRKPVKSCNNCKGTGWLSEPRLSACASDADTAWLEARK